MTELEELKLLATKHRWAYKELAYDAKMSEANQLYDGRAAYKYLRVRYGGKVILKKVIREIESFTVPAPKAGSKKELMQIVFQTYPWALGELVRVEKDREAKELFKSVQGMYQYLKEVLGSRAEVLDLLRWLVRVQSGPRKSLHL